MFGWEWKSGGMKNVSLYKFTHTPLIKNDGQLKPKSDKQPKKKKQSPNLLKNKNHVKKIMSILKKKRQLLGKKRKKEKKKKEATCLEPGKKKTEHGYFCPLSSSIFSL